MRLFPQSSLDDMRVSEMQRQKRIASVRFPSLLIFLSLIFFFFFLLLVSVVVAVDDRSDGKPVLPQEEVEALRQIGMKLKEDENQWNATVRNCSSWDEFSFGNISTRLPLNRVTCDCSFENRTICHVTDILLTRQNLTGVLPDELANLTYLRHLDLSRNYLSGPIPAAWGSLPVLNLSIHGNRISGEIPKEIGNMPMIRSLQFENNELSGILPVEIGNLLSLERLFISGNYITGAIPSSFSKLTNMTDWIDGNNISGTIPDFLSNWRRVNRIDMVGTSMSGPFPKSIDLLQNLTELRVSDIDGPDMGFPALQNAKHLTELVLRNCSIYGEIPSYMGTMKYLKVLDLSFNKLSGQVPPNFESLAALEYLYLTDNDFTGEIPPWLLRNKQSNKINIDISYNNFTGSPPSDCQEGNVNMVASFSSSRDNSVAPCFRKDFPCSTKPQYRSFYINCGGPKTVINGIEYDEDSSQLGTSAVHIEKSGRWAYSSTGDFTGNEDADFIATNTSTLNMTYSELYGYARLTPLSLKYYGLCLENGNYSVQLHFAEIIFTNDQTYWSLGKRIFDVFIQGRNVLNNFNIKERAGGSGRVLIMNFTVPVTDNTLEIHLYWAGKGTTAIPERGIYGPLISAISVTQSSAHGEKDTKTTEAVLGATAGFLVLCAVIITLLWKNGCLKRSKEALKLHILQRQPNYYFKIKDINAATRNFHPLNKIGEGGFGPVFKGVLADGTQIAVKKLSANSKQGIREFVNEIGTVSALHHPNLVKLFGCCTERDKLLLIYEYMENNSLERALFGKLEHRMKISWGKRFMICLGVAKGLTFLHDESSLRIVHRDIKASNILLDKNLNPKISDFGLAKLDEKDKTHISTRIAGTAGYMAPEYATRGYLTDKADVYSFGVVTLEVVSGNSNTKFNLTDEFFYLVDWALILFEEGRIMELVDPGLGTDYSQEEVLRVLHVSLLCTNPSPTQRPTMSMVVRMLLGEVPIPPVLHHTVNEEWKNCSAVYELYHSEERQTQTTTGSSSKFYEDEDVISQEISC